MRSHPYFGIMEPVASVSREIIEGADGYHKVHAARLTRTAELLVQNLPDGATVLELGTSGYFPLVLKEVLPSVTIHGTHFDLTSPPTSTQTFALGERSIDVTVHSLDLEYTPLPVDDETYDVVLCCEVLEHMEIDPMFMLSEVNRVIKPGGTLLLTTPNITSSRALHKILEGYAPYFYMQYHKSREYHRHNYEYSAPMLSSVLSAAGFTGKVWSEDLFDDGLSGIVEKLRLCGFPAIQVGDNLIALATKTSGVVDRFPDGLYI